MVDATTVENWFDDRLVQSVERHEETDDLFHFTVTFDLDVEVRRETEDGPVIVESEYEFRPYRRDDLLDDEESARKFVRSVTEILANARGFYQYVGEDGEIGVRIGNAEVVRIHHRIYPDEASQHELMNSIVDIVVSLNGIWDLSDMLYGNLYD